MAGEQTSRICIFLILFQLNSATAHNGLKEIITCEGRCGEFIGFWCSCQSTCVVHRNCCENMTTYCPQTVADGHLQYGHLLQSDVICHEMGIFVIFSCPRQSTKDSTLSTIDAMVSPERRHDGNAETTQEELNATLSLSMLTLDSLKATPTSGESTLTGQNTSYSQTLAVIEDMFYNNVVITDMSTNLSYLNKNIFLCNGGNLSNSISWEVVIDTNHDEPTGDVFSYYPPKYLRDTLLGCTDKYEPVTCAGTGQTELEKLCQSFTSYVKFDSTVFKNRFCFLCSSDTSIDNLYYHEIRIKSHFYLAAVSISLRNNSIDLILKSDYGKSNAYGFWKILACTLNDIDKVEEIELKEELHFDMGFQTVVQRLSQLPIKTVQCQIMQCIDKYLIYLRPDGNCKLKNYVYFEFPISSFPLSKTQLSVLPQFVNCSLRNYIGIEVIDVREPASILYDIVKEERVFVVVITAYLTLNSWEIIREPLLSKHFIVNKALTLHLMAERTNDPNVHQQYRSDEKCAQSWDIAVPSSHQLRKIVLNSTSSIPFCVRVTENYIVDEALCETLFQCYYDFIYESDLVEIEEFSKLNCLSLLKSRNGQDSIDTGLGSVLTIWFVTLIMTI